MTPNAPDLAARVADLEAYVTNGAPKALVAPGPRPQRLDDDLRRAGALHDAARPGAVLRRACSPQERPVRDGPMPGLRGLVTILWWAVGYSLVFAPGHARFWAGSKFALLKGVDLGAQRRLRLLGLAERVRDVPADVRDHHAGADRRRHRRAHEILGRDGFIVIWMFVVYFPLAHMVWGVDGFMNGVWNAKAGIKAIDFAGGTVVHMSSGWSALVLCLILGKRNGFGKRAFFPHSLVLDDGRHRHALGRLVRVQRGQRGRGRWDRRQRVHDDHAGGGGGGRRLAGDGVAEHAASPRSWASARARSAGLVVITPAAGFVTPIGGGR